MDRQRHPLRLILLLLIILQERRRRKRKVIVKEDILVIWSDVHYFIVNILKNLYITGKVSIGWGEKEKEKLFPLIIYILVYILYFHYYFFLLRPFISATPSLHNFKKLLLLPSWVSFFFTPSHDDNICTCCHHTLWPGSLLSFDGTGYILFGLEFSALLDKCQRFLLIFFIGASHWVCVMCLGPFQK